MREPSLGSSPTRARAHAAGQAGREQQKCDEREASQSETKQHQLSCIHSWASAAVSGDWVPLATRTGPWLAPFLSPSSVWTHTPVALDSLSMLGGSQSGNEEYKATFVLAP